MKEMLLGAREDYGAAMNVTQMILGGELVPNIPQLLEIFEIMYFWKDKFIEDKENNPDQQLKNSYLEIAKWFDGGINSYRNYFLDHIEDLINGIFEMHDRGLSGKERQRIHILCDFMATIDCPPVWARLKQRWLDL